MSKNRCIGCSSLDGCCLEGRRANAAEDSEAAGEQFEWVEQTQGA
jgi:hypothetical protein